MLSSSNSPRSFYYDQISPNAIEDQNQEKPFILNNFLSSFDENESPLCQIFSRNNKPMAMDHHQESNNNNDNNNIGSTSKKKCNDELQINGVIKPPPRRRKNADGMLRKRTGKKDRHSKICTAQGVRDRRMRLSLPIARKFFDLQDMLGFDKASKTIEWLFSKSRKSIKKLIISQNLPPPKQSYLNDDYINDDDDDDGDGDDDDDLEMEEINNEFVRPGDSNYNEARNEMITYEKEEVSKTKKVMNNSKNAKESREKARERARERTIEKMRIRRSKLWYDSNNLANNNNLDQPFSSNNFHDSQKVEFHHEGYDHHHTIGHLYENLGNYDGNNLAQMDIHQTFNFEKNDEMIVPHEIECSYTNNGLMEILTNWDANGNRMNPSNIGATTSNMISVSGNNNPTSFWCLPSSRTFPFSLQ